MVEVCGVKRLIDGAAANCAADMAPPPELPILWPKGRAGHKMSVVVPAKVLLEILTSVGLPMT